MIRRAAIAVSMLCALSAQAAEIILPSKIPAAMNSTRLVPVRITGNEEGRGFLVDVSYTDEVTIVETVPLARCSATENPRVGPFTYRAVIACSYPLMLNGGVVFSLRIKTGIVKGDSALRVTACQIDEPPKQCESGSVGLVQVR